MNFKPTLFVLALTASALQTAQAQSLDTIFRKFSQCDASFFKSMKDGAQVIQTLAPTNSNSDVLWLKVPNRNDEASGSLVLSGKPTIAGIPVVSYLDEATDMGNLGQYYYWGFKVRGAFSDVLDKLRPLVFEGERLRKDAPVYVRTEMKRGASAWMPVNTVNGVPKKGTVERAFLFEPDDKDENLVKVFCSLQGSVEGVHLKELRPDIDMKEYPVNADPMGFDLMNPPSALVSKLQEAIKAQPLFFPKYKKVVATYITRADESPKIVSRIHLGNGLLEVEEQYGTFTMRRQLIGEVVQVKYGSFDLKNVLESAGVAESASIEFTQNLVRGQVAYKSEVTRFDVFPRKSLSPIVNKKICTVGEQIPASNIFKSLPGDAILLICNPESEFASGLALIKDLGLTLWYELPNSKSAYKPMYTSITIER